MPPLPTCECGTCLTCRKRAAHCKWRLRRGTGGASKSEKSEAARQSALVRWRRQRQAAESWSAYSSTAVSDAELDRRALAKWRPEWSVRGLESAELRDQAEGSSLKES